MRALLFFLSLLASSMAISQASVDLKLTQKGYYKVKTLTGTVFPENYSALNTAETRAMTEALKCNCEIRIVPPEISVIMTLASSPAPAPTVSTVTYSWNIPTTRANGAALPATELREFKIYLVRSDSAESIPVQVVKMPATSVSSPTLQPGGYLAGISAVDTGGLESGISPLISFNVP